MKKLLTLTTLFMLLAFPLSVMGADAPVSSLGELTTPAPGDEVPIVDISGTPTTKKIKVSNLTTLVYYVDSTEPDQGIAGSGRSAEDLRATIGTNYATVVFQHHGSAQTDYTFSTSFAFHANTTVIVKNGAILSDGGGAADLTINGPFEASLCKVFDWTGSGAVSFGDGAIKENYPEWWGIDGTADEVQIQQAIDSFPIATGASGFPSMAFGGTVILSGEYTIASAIEIPEGIWLQGVGKFKTRIYNGNTAGDNAIECLDGGRASAEFFARVSGIHLTGNASSGHGLYVEKTHYSTYDNMLIDRHGGDGIHIEGVTVGGNFQDVYCWNNDGWGLKVGTDGLTTTNTVLRFESCQFRVNDLGGAHLFRCSHVQMTNCIYESNVGVGARIEGWGNVLYSPYFENNSGGAAALQLLFTSENSATCYGNVAYSAWLNGGYVQFSVTATNNHLILPKLSTANPNVIIDAGCPKNAILFPATQTTHPLNLTDNGGSTMVITEGKLYTKEIYHTYGVEVKSEDVYPFQDDNYWLGEIGAPYKSYKGVVLKDTTDGKHYKITVVNGVVTATALD